MRTTFRLFWLTLLMATANIIWAQSGDGYHRLTNLPHVYIETLNGRNIVSKTMMIYARMLYVDEQDNVTYFDSLEIRIRGNSTASLAKKPYKLKFHKKEKLLGKGYANTKKWTLMANHGDKTLLRNALTSLMGERAGLKFNPAAKFVDLTLNGTYVGNYQLSDQVDVRPHRVNVAEQDYPLQDDSDISGGYLLEADGFKDFVRGQSGFYTDYVRVPVRVHYPDEDDIAPSQLDYIKTFVNDFESRLFSPTFDDPLSGYRPLVDSVSLANWYICTEVSGNVDGFFSTYFYKDRADNRLYWGPLWDYDIAYNNDNRSDRGGTSNTEQQLMKDYGYDVCRMWPQQMWRDPWFASLINRRFKELVDDGLEAYLNDKLDSLTALIDESQQLNYKRWSINTRALRERVLYTSYNQYVEDVRTYLNRHIKYLTRAFADLLPDGPQEEPEQKVAEFMANSERYYTIVNVNTGTCFDVDLQTDRVCSRRRDENSESQQWRITNLSNGYLFIVNRATGKALCDPSPVGTTATTNTGEVLYLAEPDSTDTRQLWDFVSQQNRRYNIISRWSQHAANLRNGNADDGTPILSYTSDARNSVSGNRIWLIEEAGQVDAVSSQHIQQDYALAYDSYSGLLHFGADDLDGLTFTVRIYNHAGRQVAAFRASDGLSMLPYPAGLYIVTWKVGQRQMSVKMIKD